VARAAVKGLPKSLTPELLEDIYYHMVLARALDDRMWILNRQGRAPVVYTSNGHEGVQVASAFALDRGRDWVVPYYRDLALMVAMGMTPREIFLHLLARADDPNSGGRQMPAHWGLKRLNIMTSGSVVITQMLHAAGLALAAKMRGEDTVAVAYFGEGSTSQGEFHEALNIASVWKLPVVFVNENNGYAISVPQRKQMAIANVADRAQGYGIPGVVVDGQDPIKVYEVMSAAVERARRGDGPTLIEAKTYRFVPHSSDDDDRAYRSREEVAEHKKFDPLVTFQATLRDMGILDDAKVEAMQKRARAAVDDATRFAEKAPEPDPSTLLKHVYYGD
jgi:2-oxoisovalerate dehydrogenase E1 component alpha subunit